MNWISVKDKLPEAFAPVIVARPYEKDKPLKDDASRIKRNGKANDKRGLEGSLYSGERMDDGT